MTSKVQIVKMKDEKALVGILTRQGGEAKLCEAIQMTEQNPHTSKPRSCRQVH